MPGAGTGSWEGWWRWKKQVAASPGTRLSHGPTTGPGGLPGSRHSTDSLETGKGMPGHREEISGYNKFHPKSIPCILFSFRALPNLILPFPHGKGNPSAARLGQAPSQGQGKVWKQRKCRAWKALRASVQLLQGQRSFPGKSRSFTGPWNGLAWKGPSGSPSSNPCQAFGGQKPP